MGTALWSVMHEAGHAMYENGVAPEFGRSPLGHGLSLGFHESQSRLWENWVGRSRPYLTPPPADACARSSPTRSPRSTPRACTAPPTGSSHR